MSPDEKEQWHNRKQKWIKNKIQEDDVRKRLATFVAKADEFDDRLSDNPLRCIESVAPERSWVFVVGMARTGGTYLLNELVALAGEDLTNYEFRMIHDGIPIYENLAFWRRDEQRRKLQYELAQWLAWVQLEMDSFPLIPKKRISFAHALPYLDGIFGDRAHYIFTIRHPGELADSWAEMENLNRDGLDETQKSWWAYMSARTGIDRESWTALEFRDRVLLLWEQYHRDIAESVPISGTVDVLKFGPAYSTFIARQAEAMEVDHQPDEFSATDRTLADEWRDETVNETIESVRSTWDKHGLTFPELNR